jgi:hypothetical protein
LDPALASFVLGYHGCDAQVAKRVIEGKTSLALSHNDYDWLGDGIYFWEHNAQRAFDFAVEMSRRPHPSGQQIRKPAVVGVVIDLGYCLNLLNSRAIEFVVLAYNNLIEQAAATRIIVPKNTGGADLVDRKLDCAVIRELHRMRADGHHRPFDSVRAAFVEGAPLYENAGFRAKTHIQICVRDPRSIKGCFIPLGEDGKPMTFA